MQLCGLKQSWNLIKFDVFYVLVFKSFELGERTFVSASQPPYSPDVYPRDFSISPKRREHVSGINVFKDEDNTCQVLKKR